jgi:hypothetical protein
LGVILPTPTSTVPPPDDAAVVLAAALLLAAPVELPELLDPVEVLDELSEPQPARTADRAATAATADNHERFRDICSSFGMNPAP